MARSSKLNKALRRASARVRAGMYRRTDTNDTVEKNVEKRMDRVDRAASGKLKPLSGRGRSESIVHPMRQLVEGVSRIDED